MSSRADLASRQAAGSQIRQAPPLNPPRSYLRVPLDTPIAPLVSCHGNSHINFPKTIKDYYELDSMTLDSLMVFFNQTRPETTDTRRYPTIVAPWLTWDYERQGWQTDAIDIESKRCRFGEFIGLTDELVDPKLLNLQRLHAERDKPVQNPSGETPSGVGAVERPMMRREKRKGLFRRLPFGK